MNSEAESRAHFDRWAESYDEGVGNSSEFPLAQYRDVLSRLMSLADVRPSMSVLDLGTGTGNLAELFFVKSCSVWATDSSPGMIERARAKQPGIQFSVADLRDGVPAAAPKRFDRIVSAYAFHHLELSDKAALIEDLALKHLSPQGRLLVADVAFRTAREREAAERRYSDHWDPCEHYWAADETEEILRRVPVDVSYSHVSPFAGVFVVQPTAAAAGDG